VAYEGTREIQGRAYRYRVKTVRDPVSGRDRAELHFVGRVKNGRLVAPARSADVTRDELVAMVAELLDTRDASRVTITVIAQHAGISIDGFYRCFSDRRDALAAALALVCGPVLEGLPSLAGPVGTSADERSRLAGWFAALHRAVLRGRAFRWLVTGADVETSHATLAQLPSGIDPQHNLAAYLDRLHAAGHAEAADGDALATALLGLHAASVRDLALQNEAADAVRRWAMVLLVIERAVFGDAPAGQGTERSPVRQPRERLHDHDGDRPARA
jgi:AcrR family transcriptional regulator